MFSRTTAISAAALVCAAGLAIAQNTNTGSSMGQDTYKDAKHADMKRDKDARRDTAVPAVRAAGTAESIASDFRSWDWLKGKNVVNSQNEDIGTLTDLIIDRGTGRAKFAVVKTGTTMGMGGKTVTVPFRELTWGAGREAYTIQTAAEDLKTYPEFNDDQWKNVRTGYAANSTDRRYGSADRENDLRKANPGTLNDWMQADSGRGSDWHGSGFDNNLKKQITGEIKNVSRERSPHYGEYTIVEIADKDGTMKKVALGPTWYVSGSETALNRGDQITVDVVPIHIATSAQVNGKTLALRNDKGAGEWSGNNLRRGGQEYSTAYSRYVLASKLDGAKLDCRAASCGKVDDVIIEGNTGSIAFLSIDPDANFMGIADKKRLVPWTVSSVSMDETIRLDVSKEMLASGQQTPDDVRTISGMNDALYRGYNVEPRTFDRWDDSNDWRHANWRDND